MRHSLRLSIWLVLASVSAVHAAELPAASNTAPSGETATTVTVCAAIAEAAKANDLPLEYLTRLIWRESRFHANALSPAGAQGVAQFMPSTAAERGLVDPFAVHQALAHSASFLAELRTSFGNLGLAAAAYNAGPGRVSRWLAGETVLPQETLDYVTAITGQEAEAWRAAPPPQLRSEAGFDCVRWTTLMSRMPGSVPTTDGSSVAAPPKPWAVILIGNPQRDKAMDEYRLVRGRYAGILGDLAPSVVRKRISGMQIPRFIVQIERASRSDADALCSRLLRAGGNCFVLANRS